MKKISREFKIGMLVVVSVALLFMGVNYLKGINLFQQQRTFYAVYPNVDGLAESNPVILNGFKIGIVRDVRLNPNGDGTLLVQVLINDNGLKIPSDSKAKIFTSDLFGSKAVKMELGQSLVMAEPNDTLQSEMEEDLATSLQNGFEPLKAKIDELTGDIDIIITNMKAVFEDSATQGLPKVFESLQRTMETLEQTSLSIDMAVDENRLKLSAIMSNAQSITQNLQNNNASLSKVIKNFESISDSLAQVDIKQTLIKTDKAMSDFAAIVEKIERGEGTIGMLINNDSLHTALMSTNQELDMLINDIYENPWRYIHVSIFGKKEKKRYSKKELEQINELVDKALKENQSSPE